MIREWLQRLLSIDTIHSHLLDIRENRLSDRKLLNRLSTQMDAIGPGLGRVIAKLDAKYAESEHSPERKAESDAIGEEVIRRLNAEAKARAPYND